MLCKAKKDYAKGEYQWVAQITKELVFADPSNQKARNLCADALEQLGYQAESGAWRNAYLMGAAELRNGNLSGRARTANGLTNSMRAMTVSMLLDYIAILTDANAAQNDDLTLTIVICLVLNTHSKRSPIDGKIFLSIIVFYFFFYFYSLCFSKFFRNLPHG